MDDVSSTTGIRPATPDEADRLIHLVGGQRATLERAHPVLDVLGAGVYHLGPVGAGAAMRLAVNATFAVQAAALAELLATLADSGLDPVNAVDVLNTFPTASPAAARAATLMSEGSRIFDGRIERHGRGRGDREGRP